MGAFDTDKQNAEAVRSEHAADNGSPDNTETVAQATPVERIFMVQAHEIRNRIDRIGQTVQATQYLVAMGVVILAVVAWKMVGKVAE